MLTNGTKMGKMNAVDDLYFVTYTQTRRMKK